MRTKLAHFDRRPALLVGALTFFACMIVIYATPRDAFWIVDGGTKSLVAQRMLATGYGDLSFEYPAEFLDPEGVAFPIPPPYAVNWNGRFLSFYPPAFSAITAPFLGPFGRAGLRFPAALGVAACASLFALWLAPVVGRRRAAMGGLVLATATPLFFYGVTVWEHSLTVSLPLAAVVVLHRTSKARLLVAGFLAGSACWLREELSLMLLALAIACWLERRRIADGVVFSLGAAPAVLGLLAFNWLIFGTPLGLHVAGSVGGSAWASGFAFELSAAGLGHSLALVGAQLSALGANKLEALLFSLALVAIALLGMTTLGRRTAGPVPLALTLALGLGTWLCGTTRILLDGWPMLQLVPYNGLMLQLPLFCLVVMGTAAIWQCPTNAPLRLGVMAGILFMAFEVAFRAGTELYTGGQWGPRELLPAFPAVVAVAWAAIQADTATGADTDEASDTPASGATLLRWGGVALVSAGLLSTVLSIWLLMQQKKEAEKLQDKILSASTNVVLTTKPILAAHLATLFDQRAMMLLKDERALSRIAGNLRAHDIEEFLLVTQPGALGPSGCLPQTRHRGRFVHYSDSDLFTCSPRAMAKAVP